jgi:hypothetical protein
MTGLWTQKFITIAIFTIFQTKSIYYYNYYVVILQCKVELYIANNLIIHLSMLNELLLKL